MRRMCIIHSIIARIIYELQMTIYSLKKTIYGLEVISAE